MYPCSNTSEGSLAVGSPSHIAIILAVLSKDVPPLSLSSLSDCHLTPDHMTLSLFTILIVVSDVPANKYVLLLDVTADSMFEVTQADSSQSLTVRWNSGQNLSFHIGLVILKLVIESNCQVNPIPADSSCFLYSIMY